jgi:BirA family biotin operon repressor/biotin-[acetyl-CoA-carboxylase] ligase
LFRVVNPSETIRERATRLAEAVRPTIENIALLDAVDSTHALVLRLIEQAENEEQTLPATLVIAGRQDHGAGRFGRRWASPPGGLYLSWLRCGLDAGTIASLPMVAAAATHEAVSRLGVRGAKIKWPNDILIGGRKLAGLLIHARHGTTSWAAVGLGVNVAAVPEIPGGPTALATGLGNHLPAGDPERWADDLIRVFVAELAAGIDDTAAMVARWRAHLLHQPGEPLTVRLGDGVEIGGRFAGLTDAGHLRLEVDGAERVVSSGEVIQ